MKEKDYTEAIIQDPLVTGGGGRRWTVFVPNNEFSAVLPGSTPLPAVADVLSGFDAVFQFSADLLGSYAASKISISDYEIDYREYVLSETARDGLLDTIVGREDGDVATALPTATMTLYDYEYQSEAYVVRLRSPNFQFLEDAALDRAKFSWQFDLLLRRKETIESFTLRRGMIEPVSGGPPGASGPTGVSTEGWGPNHLVEQYIPLGSGVLKVYATPVVVADVETLSLGVKLDHSDWVINVDSSESLVSELLDLEETQIRTGITDLVYDRFLKIWDKSGFGVALTPVLSFKPNPPLDESVLGDPTDRRLTVSQKVTDGNLPFSQVFCIGINTGEGTGDIEAVQPFTASGNYAVAMSEEIVTSVVRSRWESAQHSLSSAIEDIEYTISAEGESFSGVGCAEVRANFQIPDEVNFDTGPDESLPNSLRLAGEYELRMDKLILEDGTRLLPDQLDGDFSAPLSQPYALHILPFWAPSEPIAASAITDFFARLGAHLLRSVYFPFPNGGLTLARLAGSLHSPSGVIIMNGSARVS